MRKPNQSVVIESIGVAHGRNIVSNGDLAQIMDTNDEWIFSRTGIRFRNIADSDETNCTLGLNAAIDAIERIGSQARRIRAIYFATNTNQSNVPTGVSEIHAKLKKDYPELVGEDTFVFDLVGGCHGFNSALNVAGMSIGSGDFGKDLVMVIGADKLTSVADFRTEGRDIAVLAGDEGSAFILGPSDEPDAGYVGHASRTVSSARDLIRFLHGKERVD